MNVSRAINRKEHPENKKEYLGKDDYFKEDLSVKQAAQMLNVSTSHVYQLLADGFLTGYKIGTKTMRIHYEALNHMRGHPAAFVDYSRNK